MSVKKEAYLCLSAMLRAREPKMLTMEKAVRMLDAPSFEEAAKLLGDHGYEDMSAMNAEEIDTALSAHRAAIFDELERLVPQRELVDLFRTKYDYHNAKAVLKAEAMGQDPKRLLSSSGRIAPEALLAAYDEEQFNALPKPLGEAMQSAGELLARTANPQLADFELDKAYFAELKAIAKAAECLFAESYVRLLIDAANLKSTVRTARMHKSEDFLRGVLIPGGMDIDRFPGADGDALSALFAHGPLETAAQLGAKAMAGGSQTAFERALDNAATAFLRAVKLHAYGPEVIVAYLAAVEGEITAVRMILTGRRAGVKSETIKERLRDLYA